MPKPPKPALFIGSSVESLAVAYALQENLERDAEVTPWPQGVFDPSKYTLESILDQLQRTDFGVFVFGADDLTQIRGNEYRSVRDNVLFELGLFIGRLGKERSFFLIPRGEASPRLPTDLLGITPLSFEPERSDGNLTAAVGPASNRIRSAIQRLGSRHKTPESLAGSNLASSTATDKATIHSALALHEFSGDEKKLQESRIALAEHITLLLQSPLDQAAVRTIHALGIQQHNSATALKVSKKSIPLHTEETDALNQLLVSKILALDPQRAPARAEAINAVGVVYNNIISMLRARL